LGDEVDILKFFLYGLSMASNKDVKQLIKKAEAQGWIITHSRGGHLRFYAPDGHLLFFSATPSDPRAIKNHISQMCRYGFVK
jgi:predicted RNA binding protein YcfA (HicA-like mRNA interferase family)